MIAKEDIHAVKHIPMELVLNELGFKRDKRGFYECPYHTEDTPSGKITPRSNLFYCFGCGTQKNNIELVMDIKGLTFPESVAYLQQIDREAPCMVKEFLPSKDQEETPDEKHRQNLSKFSPYSPQQAPSRQRLVLDHLNERGLKNAIKTLRSNGYDIGTIHHKKHTNIAYKFGNHLVIRYPNNNCNSGTPQISPLVVDSASPYFYICEGITDAMAVAETGYNSLILHSVNNVKALIEYIKADPNASTRKYIIATDNDDAGLKAKHKLEAFFYEYGLKYRDAKALRLSNCKDLGEFYKLKFNHN